MKKILNYIILSILIVFGFSINVGAEENPFYTNLNGATLTESQYNNLRTVFSENTIATMTVEQIDLIKNETDFNVSNETHYIKTIDYYENNKYRNSVSSEVTEYYALNYDPSQEVMPMGWNVSIQPGIKKLYMQVVTGNSLSIKIVTITNTWMTLPKVRAYDVIALRPDSSWLILNNDKKMISGYQLADGTRHPYDGFGANTNLNNNGVGISMNLVNNATYELENSMTVYFVSGANPFKIYGSYQHATSETSQSESLNYDFNANGLGGVIDFKKDSIKNKYDKMQGVFLSYNSGDELFG